MTDAERRAREAEARATFERVLAKFLALPDSEGNGSVALHFQAHRVRKVEWKTLDDADKWNNATGDAA